VLIQIIKDEPLKGVMEGKLPVRVPLRAANTTGP
jgi:hypothetical protein